MKNNLNIRKKVIAILNNIAHVIKKLASTIITIAITFMLILSFLIIGTSFAVTEKNDSMDVSVKKIFFDYTCCIVKTGSMVPLLEPGDLIMIKGEDNLKKGDIITYFYPESIDPQTHKIVDVKKDTFGNEMYKTKGDNNNIADDYMPPEQKVIGKYLFKIPKVGFIVDNLKNINYKYRQIMLLFNLLIIYIISFIAFYSESKRIIKKGNNNDQAERLLEKIKITYIIYKYEHLELSSAKKNIGGFLKVIKVLLLDFSKGFVNLIKFQIRIIFQYIKLFLKRLKIIKS